MKWFRAFFGGFVHGCLALLYMVLFPFVVLTWMTNALTYRIHRVAPTTLTKFWLAHIIPLLGYSSVGYNYRWVNTDEYPDDKLILMYLSHYKAPDAHIPNAMQTAFLVLTDFVQSEIRARNAGGRPEQNKPAASTEPADCHQADATAGVSEEASQESSSEAVNEEAEDDEEQADVEMVTFAPAVQ